MGKIISIIWILMGVLMLTFIGVKEHPEHVNDRMIIVKHRPIFKLVFYSPILSSDDAKFMEDLTPEEQVEEMYYREFIKREGAKTIDNVALVFFQLGIYLILINLLKLIFFRRKNKIKAKIFFSINLVGIAFSMLTYQIYWTAQIDLLEMVGAQIVLNILIIFPWLRKNSK